MFFLMHMGIFQNVEKYCIEVDTLFNGIMTKDRGGAGWVLELKAE
jgi:hypothetical protein